MDSKETTDDLKSRCEVFHDYHPQTSAFFNLFPKPDRSISVTCNFAVIFGRLWDENVEDNPWSFIGASSTKPDFDDLAAEKRGIDYVCRLKILLKNGDNQKIFYIDDLPYPNNDGEFVINGNRYFIPMFLRDNKQLESMKLDMEYYNELKIIRNKPIDADEKEAQKSNVWNKRESAKKALSKVPHDRQADNLNVILLDEFLENRLQVFLENEFKRLKGGIIRTNIPKLHLALRNKLIHPFIVKYGQLLDQNNPLSRLSQLKELSFYGFWGGLHPDSTKEFLLRDVCEDDLYRICPVQTPQGHQVGLRLFLARQASINMEARKIAAPESPDAGDSLSDASSLVPFIEHNDVSRALMGSNMMKQALPLVRPDVPWIQTGWERNIAAISFTPDDFKRDGLLCMGKNVTTAYIPWGLDTFEDGIVISESAAVALAAYEEKTYWKDINKKSVQNRRLIKTVISRDNPKVPEKNKRHLDENGIVIIGTYVKPGDILISAYDGYSETLKKTDLIDIYTRSTSLSEYGKIKNNSLYVPANFHGKVIQIIDTQNDNNRRIGIVIRHESKVSIGDKISSRHGSKGVVVRILSDCDMPYYKTRNSYCSHPECRIEEPHRHIQVILNPIGVIGRLNVGQLYETTLAKIAERKKEPFIIKSFQNDFSREKLSEELKAHGFSSDGMEQLFITEAGKGRPLHYKSLVGPQYFLRLHHLSEHKIQARESEEPFNYTARDDQPKTGKTVFRDRIIGSAQRVGEMEIWALAGHGAWHILDDLLHAKSDDEMLRKQIKISAFIADEGHRRPQALVNLILVFRALCLDLRLFNDEGINVTNEFIENKSGTTFSKMSLSWASESQTEDWHIIDEVTSERLFVIEKEKSLPAYDPDGLYSRKIFPPECNWQMGKIVLAKQVPHPVNSEFQINVIPVLPRIFRIEKSEATNFHDNLNILYQHVIVANNKLMSSLKNNDSEKENEKWTKILEKRIGNLFFGIREMEGVYDILRGKKGLIRGHLAGKRADYSGRAVIVADPELDLDEVSIPKVLWDRFFPDISPSEKPLLLINRQPSLHRYSFLSFKAVVHQFGNVIGMNPFVCRPFNADFDGDTVSIHIPKLPAAKKEAGMLLPSHNLLSQANGKPVLGFEKDIALGIVYITHHPGINTDSTIPFTTEEEIPLMDLSVWEKVVCQNTETTVGRLLFRRLFPKSIIVPNRSIDSKLWDRLLSELFVLATSNRNSQLINDFTRELCRVLIPILKHSGLSLSLNNFKTLDVLSHDKDMPSFLLLLSKTGKYNANLENQIIKSRGIMRKPGSDDLTKEVPSNLMEGHSETEYLTTAHGARSGLVDKGVITAPAGSAMRKWIYHLQHLYIVQEDCRSKLGLSYGSIDPNQIIGIRYDVNSNLITEFNENEIFRSPLTCQAQDENGNHGICAKCYGHDPSTGRLPEIGLPVGILASQALGERVSQESMKSFHTGGTQKAEESEKAGIELIEALQESLSQYKDGKTDPLQTIQKMWQCFPKSSKPRLIHFEVLLKGCTDEYNSLMSDIAKTQDKRQIFIMAGNEHSDNLFSVMSRIISGRILSKHH